MAIKPTFLRLYIVFTYYQLRVVLAHRRGYPPHGRCVLVYHLSLKPSAEHLAGFDELIEFDAVPGIIDSRNQKAFGLIGGRIEQILNMQSQALPDAETAELVVCSAGYPVINWLIVKFHRRMTVNILADGLSAYLPLRKPVIRLMTDLLRKLYLQLGYGVSARYFYRHPHGLDSDMIGALYGELPEFLSTHKKPVFKLPQVFASVVGAPAAATSRDVWFLGQPHTGRSDSALHTLLTQLLAALRADHPQARRFIYKRHHFEHRASAETLRAIGFEVEASRVCAEELLAAASPLAVYSYRSTALMSLRRTLPAGVPVVSFAPWLIKPPDERLVEGSIAQWMLRLGVDRPKQGSAIFQLEAGLRSSRAEQTDLPSPAQRPLS